MTKKRAAILAVLKNTGDLLSAAELHRELPEIDLATIYRNLDLFTREGIIKKLTFGDEARFEYQQQPHHHAICDDCGRTIHFTVSPEKLAALLPVADFASQTVDITVRGTCAYGHQN